jgi:hypothetical protein
VAEWLMAPVLKTGIPERVSGVRIPPSPPESCNPNHLASQFTVEGTAVESRFSVPKVSVIRFFRVHVSASFPKSKTGWPTSIKEPIVTHRDLVPSESRQQFKLHHYRLK